MTRFQVNDGLSLAYQDEPGGPGAPLLCLAGLTRCGSDFDFFADAMNARRRVIRLDSRGRGGSDHDPDFSKYNAMTEAEDAIALLDHLGVEKVVAVGSSRGGILAALIAATAPERLDLVILNDVGGRIEPAGMNKIMGYLGVQPKVRTMKEAATVIRSQMQEAFTGADEAFWLAWAERSFTQAETGLKLNYDPKLRDAVIPQLEATDPDGPGLWPLFAALHPVSTLLLRGANSDLLTMETVNKMRSDKPDLRFAEIPGRGHIPRLDEPEALSAINAFLDERDAANG